MARDRRPRPPDRRAAPGRGRPADDGGRADLRLGRRHGRGRVEHDRPRTRQAGPGGPPAHEAPRPVRPGRHAPPRAGEVVPGRVAAAMGALAATGGGTASPSGRIPAWSPTSRSTTATATEEARRFSRVLAERLGVDPSHSIPGYEDVWYYLWKERRLPVERRPARGASSRTPRRRRRLAKVFEQGLDHVVGYALPLRRDRSTDEPLWASGPWVLRSEHLFLIPGDSPMGFACRSTRSPGRAPATSNPCSSATHSPPGSRSPAARGAVAPAADRRAPFGAVAGTSERARGVPDPVPRRTVRPRGRPHGALRGASRRPPLHLHAAAGPARGLPRAGRRRRGHRPRAPSARADRGLPPAPGPPDEPPQRHPRPGRDRGQPPPGAELGRAGRADHHPPRGGPPDPPGHREVHDRRPAFGHRRREPRGHRRPDPSRQPDPPSARPAPEPGRLLA